MASILASLGLRRAPVAGPSRLPTTPLQVRHRGELAPRRVKHRKAFKGRVPVRTGGSIRGTTLTIGDYGVRVKEPVRISAKILQSCETAIVRAIKSVKDAKCYMRVFPHIPVCVKGNETRMGKGKGSFEYWACRCALRVSVADEQQLMANGDRAPVGTVIFEVGGGGIQRQVAHAALRLAQTKLPVVSELIDRTTPARLGHKLVETPMSVGAKQTGPSEEAVRLDEMMAEVDNMGSSSSSRPIP